MIAAVGVDLVEIPTLKRSVTRWGDKFLRRVFTPAEVRYARGKRTMYQHLAGRFAVKEAVLKALGDWKGKVVLPMRHIEVVNDATGKPRVRWAGARPPIPRSYQVMVSLSHTHHYAVATAVLWRGR